MKLFRLNFFLLVSPALFLLLPLAAYAGDAGSADVEAVAAESREAFRAGIGHFKSGKFEEAAAELDPCAQNLPAVGDYALLFRARALKELKEGEIATESVKKLLTEYPESPLLRKARSLTLSLAPEEALPSLLKEYLSFYPDDDEMNFKYALFLQKDGNTEEADRIFLKIYIKAGRDSAEAVKNFSRPLSAREILARAENLLRAARFGEAENELALAEVADDGSEKARIAGLYARSFFSRKRYPEAARKYLEAGNIYEAARSFYRAGDEPSLDKALETLLSSGEDRACGLLHAYAARKRREGQHEEGVKLLEKAKESFPAKKEETLWELGWFHYTNKDFARAFAAFSELEYEFGNPLYKYWKARSIERLGGDASGIYKDLSPVKNYYGVLARLKTGEQASTAIPAAFEAGTGLDMERVEILLGAGLKDEALSELSILADKSFDPGSLLAISSKMKELGAYRRAMLVAAKLPPELQPKEVLYPAAFWEEVENASAKNEIDPYLVLSVMREESRFEPRVSSPAGALGLMQLMPETAEFLAKTLNITISGIEGIYSVETNIQLGAFYLKKLLGEFGSVPLALAAYNAGETAVRGWIEAGRYESPDEFIEDIPYGETKNYVKRIIGTYYNYRGAEAVEKGFMPPGILAGAPEKSL